MTSFLELIVLAERQDEILIFHLTKQKSWKETWSEICARVSQGRKHVQGKTRYHSPDGCIKVLQTAFHSGLDDLIVSVCHRSALIRCILFMVVERDTRRGAMEMVYSLRTSIAPTLKLSSIWSSLGTLEHNHAVRLPIWLSTLR